MRDRGLGRHRALLGAMVAYLTALTGASRYVTALRGADPVAADCPPPALDGGARWEWRGLSSAASRPLVDRFCVESQYLSWWRPYGDDPRAGAGFAERAFANAVIGPLAPLRCETVAAGFFAVGPHVDYADHAHGPDEIYVPVAGTARYVCEAYGDRMAGPDTVLEHPSWAWHSMCTGAGPTLILWVWTGDGLDRAPRFRDHQI